MIIAGSAEVQAVIGPPGLAPRQRGVAINRMRAWAAGALGDRQIGYAIPGDQDVSISYGRQHPLQPFGIGSASITCDMAVEADTAAGEISHADIEDWISGTRVIANTETGATEARVEVPNQTEPVIVTIMARSGLAGPWWPLFSGWLRSIRRRRRRYDGEVDSITYQLQDTATWLGQSALYPILITPESARSWPAETVHARFDRILNLASYLANRVSAAIDRAAVTSDAWDLAVPRSTRGRTDTSTRQVPADTAAGQSGLAYIRRVAVACGGDVGMHHGIGHIAHVPTARPATVSVPQEGDQPAAPVQLDWGGVITLAPGVVTAAAAGEVTNHRLGVHDTPIRFTDNPDDDGAAGKFTVSAGHVETDLDLHRHRNLTSWSRLPAAMETPSTTVGLNSGSDDWVRHAGWSPSSLSDVLVGTDAELRTLSDQFLAAWQRPRRTVVIDVGEVGSTEQLQAAQVLSALHGVTVDVDGTDVDCQIGSVDHRIRTASWRTRYGAAARSQLTKIGMLAPIGSAAPPAPSPHQWLQIGADGIAWADDPPVYIAAISRRDRVGVQDTTAGGAENASFSLPPIGQIEWETATTGGRTTFTGLRITRDGDYRSLTGFLGPGQFTAVWRRGSAEVTASFFQSSGPGNILYYAGPPQRTRVQFPISGTAQLSIGNTLTPVAAADFIGIRRERPAG